jgi:hypothetical protein
VAIERLEIRDLRSDLDRHGQAVTHAGFRVALEDGLGAAVGEAPGQVPVCLEAPIRDDHVAGRDHERTAVGVLAFEARDAALGHHELRGSMATQHAAALTDELGLERPQHDIAATAFPGASLGRDGGRRQHEALVVQRALHEPHADALQPTDGPQPIMGDGACEIGAGGVVSHLHDPGFQRLRVIQQVGKRAVPDALSQA